MIDLHIHTTLSDGELSPATAMRWAKAAGYRAIAFTDTSDAATMPHILERLRPMVHSYSLHAGIELFAGILLTHVPPALLPSAIAEARDRGAQIVSVYGQTLTAPVEEGSNLAAIEGGADILCHPGLITEQEASLAAERGVLLEISTQAGHAFANGHVATVARRTNAPLVLGSGARGPAEFLSRDLRRAMALGAGMTPEEFRAAEENARAMVFRLLQTT